VAFGGFLEHLHLHFIHVKVPFTQSVY